MANYQPTQRCARCNFELILMQLPDVHEEGLFLLCPNCKGWEHRFPKHHHLRPLADAAAEQIKLPPALEYVTSIKDPSAPWGDEDGA